MKKFKSGFDFEDFVFGRHSDSGETLRKKFAGHHDFSKDMKALIENISSEHPNTNVGFSLWRMVKEELEKLSVKSDGLIFSPAVGTAADIFHGVDGFFFLPLIPLHPVTVDLFNIEPSRLLNLINVWIDSFGGPTYSLFDSQSDSYLFKRGLVELKKIHPDYQNGLSAINIDFRSFCNKGRPKNHFILTPRDVGTREGRKKFAKLIADYLAKVVGQNNGSTEP